MDIVLYREGRKWMGLSRGWRVGYNPKLLTEDL
jgi:hypothetical protein